MSVPLSEAQACRLSPKTLQLKSSGPKTRKTQPVGKNIPPTHTLGPIQSLLPFPRRKSSRRSRPSKTTNRAGPAAPHRAGTSLVPLCPRQLPQPGNNNRLDPGVIQPGSSAKGKLDRGCLQDLRCANNSPGVAPCQHHPGSSTSGWFTGPREAPTGPPRRRAPTGPPRQRAPTGPREAPTGPPRQRAPTGPREAPTGPTAAKKSRNPGDSDPCGEDDVLWIDTSQLSPIAVTTMRV